MPSSLQYPIERSRSLEEKWLRMVKEGPPRGDQYDGDDVDDDEEVEDDEAEEESEPAVIREPDEDE